MASSKSRTNLKKSEVRVGIARAASDQQYGLGFLRLRDGHLAGALEGQLRHRGMHAERPGRNEVDVGTRAAHGCQGQGDIVLHMPGREEQEREDNDALGGRGEFGEGDGDRGIGELDVAVSDREVRAVAGDRPRPVPQIHGSHRAAGFRAQPSTGRCGSSTFRGSWTSPSHFPQRIGIVYRYPSLLGGDLPGLGFQDSDRQGRCPARGRDSTPWFFVTQDLLLDPRPSRCRSLPCSVARSERPEKGQGLCPGLRVRSP